MTTFYLNETKTGRTKWWSCGKKCGKTETTLLHLRCSHYIKERAEEEEKAESVSSGYKAPAGDRAEKQRNWPTVRSNDTESPYSNLKPPHHFYSAVLTRVKLMCSSQGLRDQLYYSETCLYPGLTPELIKAKTSEWHHLQTCCHHAAQDPKLGATGAISQWKAELNKQEQPQTMSQWSTLSSNKGRWARTKAHKHLNTHMDRLSHANPHSFRPVLRQPQHHWPRSTTIDLYRHQIHGIYRGKLIQTVQIQKPPTGAAAGKWSRQVSSTWRRQP